MSRLFGTWSKGRILFLAVGILLVGAGIWMIGSNLSA
ncbi:hypothetical protein FHX76_002327 [Lysinibacter cavernae]|uniref:Uncharacterized protein n=1 Tax=Lysinibacter cavernae TaxID=1640652 RepID=A0A7X5R2M6_9MICO|nr:hypothetical protein [Lysinibacter cavernae]